MFEDIELETDEYAEIAIIDADSIIHAISYVQKSPALCKKDMDAAIQKIMTDTGATTGIVYIKGANNFRYLVDKEYKGHRVDKTPPEVKERIDMLYEYAQDFAMESVDGEADDYATVTAKMARDEGKTYIVSHIDKDLNCIPGWHHNFRTGEIYYKSREESYMWIMHQILTGDATDNIKGLAKVGPITASKILAGVPLRSAWGVVVDEWKSRQGNEWLPNFIKCANNIYLRESYSDLRPLTFEELKDRLSWKTTDTGLLSASDQQEHTDSSMQSSDQQADNTSAESS
jgi:5'-3' exonuclease